MILTAFGFAVLILGAAVDDARPSPTLTDLRVLPTDGQIRAACRLRDAITPEMAEEIAAGLEVTVEYRFQVVRRRGGWLDEVLARRRVESTVRLDPLTRQYALTRRFDGAIVDSQATSDEAEMRDFVTTIGDVPLLATDRLETGREYYVRARGDLGLMWRFYLIPWRLNTDWIEMPLATGGEGVHAGRP
jgi:hypothetical protein